MLILESDLNILKSLSGTVDESALFEPLNQHGVMLLVSAVGHQPIEQKGLCRLVQDSIAREDVVQDQFEKLTVGALVNAGGQERLYDDRNDLLDDSRENAYFSLILELTLADIEQLSARDVLVLEHVVIHKIDVFPGEAVFDFAQVGLEGSS